ncbi:MAG: N-acetyl-gamma-glutamyl-phosphate reductase, partial [Ignavibacteriaceae bacterium]
MISVGILGGTGYTGKKLLQFCSAHSHIEEIKIYGNSTSGQKIVDLFPDLEGIIKNDSVESIHDLS